MILDFIAFFIFIFSFDCVFNRLKVFIPGIIEIYLIN